MLGGIPFKAHIFPFTHTKKTTQLSIGSTSTYLLIELLNMLFSMQLVLALNIFSVCKVTNYFISTKRKRRNFSKKSFYVNFSRFSLLFQTLSVTLQVNY